MMLLDQGLLLVQAGDASEFGRIQVLPGKLARCLPLPLELSHLLRKYNPMGLDMIGIKCLYIAP